MPDFSAEGVASWFERRTFYDDPPALEVVAGHKRAAGMTVGVCLPALNEATTIGAICAAISSELVTGGLVDRLVVVDSGSTDATAAAAAAAGAEVFAAADLVPAAPPVPRPGKGESLWKSLAVVETDIVVWIDSDTRNFTTAFVTALASPLLTDPDLVLAKAFYDRPLHAPQAILPMGGARVTEISIRPLINLLYPELAGFIQPLSGEYAGRRDALLELPFGTGYDVDLRLLIEVAESHGLDALAQVDLSNRVHRNRAVPELGRMSFEIVRMLLERLDESGRLKLAGELPELLTQFTDHEHRRVTMPHLLGSETRPPMRELLGY